MLISNISHTSHRSTTYSAESNHICQQHNKERVRNGHEHPTLVTFLTRTHETSPADAKLRLHSSPASQLRNHHCLGWIYSIPQTCSRLERLIHPLQPLLPGFRHTRQFPPANFSGHRNLMLGTRPSDPDKSTRFMDGKPSNATPGVAPSYDHLPGLHKNPLHSNLEIDSTPLDNRSSHRERDSGLAWTG